MGQLKGIFVVIKLTDSDFKMITKKKYVSDDPIIYFSSSDLKKSLNPIDATKIEKFTFQQHIHRNEPYTKSNIVNKTLLSPLHTNMSMQSSKFSTRNK